MATTLGMTESYNANSKYQEDVLEFGKPILLAGIDKTELPGKDKIFSIVDYGCSQGQNSVRIVRFMIEKILKREPEQGIVVVHNDLPTNNFNKVFENLYGPDSYLTLRDHAIWPLCSGMSFYHSILPKESVHCGISSSAVHWLSQFPNITFADGIYLPQAKGSILQSILQIASQDWQQFLVARSREIIKGGFLFVQTIGRRPNPKKKEQIQTTSEQLFLVIDEILHEMLQKKYLQKTVYDKFVFPAIPRSLDEALMPLKTDLKTKWVCEHGSVDEVENPYFKMYQQNKDAAQYAKDYIGFVRAFTESTFHNHLFVPGALNLPPMELTNYFYAHLQERIEQNPEEGIFFDYTLNVLFRKI